MTVFHPHGSRVLIKPDAAPDKTAGGIIIPETARDQKLELKTGTVVSMGPGMFIESGPRSGERWPMPDGASALPDIRGKKVYYFANEGVATPLKIDDVLHEILRADNIDVYVNDDGEIVPLHDRVLVRRSAKTNRTASGIWLPDTAVEQGSEGTVVAVGTGKIKFGGAILELSVAIGDHVLFGKYAGTDLQVNGERLVVIRDEEVSCIVEDEHAPDLELERTLVESEPAGGV